MRPVIKINDLVFCNQNSKIKGYKSEDFQFKIDDIVAYDLQHLDDKKINYYLGLQVKQFSQYHKINLLAKNGIKLVPSNILIPYLYKKLRQLQQLSNLVTAQIKQNLLYLNKANNICNLFQSVLGSKINYDFFKSSSGRVSANIGVLKKQQRSKIQHKKKLIELDFSSFQPTLYQDYFLQTEKIQDVYQQCQGQTRQQKKLNWYKMMFSNKIEVDYTNVFGRYMKRTLVYHLQALQTDVMRRLLVYLNELILQSDVKMLMFIFDGILFDGQLQDVQKILNKVPWKRVFPKSKIVNYPYKLRLISN